MSCNGCRVLRKGCNENCVLRQSLQGIDTPQAQANATVFVAKFFGRAGLMSFISAVPDFQRTALFQSLLFEACGRTVNPVTGAVGLLSTGNWQVCQSAVETVLRGGSLSAMPEIFGGGATAREADDASDANYDDAELFRSQDLKSTGMRSCNKRKEFGDVRRLLPEDLDLGQTSALGGKNNNRRMEKRRAASPSDASETTTLESASAFHHETKLLRLFL